MAGVGRVTGKTGGNFRRSDNMFAIAWAFTQDRAKRTWSMEVLSRFAEGGCRDLVAAQNTKHGVKIS